MVTDPVNEMALNFPLEEEFIDHSGHCRRFAISLRKLGIGGFCLDATDLSQAEGYRFEVYSTEYSAQALGASLGKLRGNIRKGIVTRYLHTDANGQRDLTHDELHGRIASDGLVVDGELLHFDDLERILTTHEGFRISIRIDDPSE
jgi:hypothetical protein